MYAADLMNGGFGVPALATVRPASYAAVATGTATTTIPRTIEIPVNHLSTRFVTFQRGDGDGAHACFAATLSVSVTIPANTSAQPYFYWDYTGSTPQPLSISGNNASISVPWDTCDWGPARGWLSIPNAGTTVDAADFTVTSTLTVDTNTPATAGKAPDPTSVWGTPIPVPTLDLPPSIDVFGPELLQLSGQVADDPPDHRLERPRHPDRDARRDDARKLLTARRQQRRPLRGAEEHAHLAPPLGECVEHPHADADVSRAAASRARPSRGTW